MTNYYDRIEVTDTVYADKVLYDVVFTDTNNITLTSLVRIPSEFPLGQRVSNAPFSGPDLEDVLGQYDDIVQSASTAALSLMPTGTTFVVSRRFTGTSVPVVL